MRLISLAASEREFKTVVFNKTGASAVSPGWDDSPR